MSLIIVENKYRKIIRKSVHCIYTLKKLTSDIYLIANLQNDNYTKKAVSAIPAEFKHSYYNAITKTIKSVSTHHYIFFLLKYDLEYGMYSFKQREFGNKLSISSIVTCPKSGYKIQ